MSKTRAPVLISTPRVWFENTREHRTEYLRNNQIVWVKAAGEDCPRLCTYLAGEDKFIYDNEDDTWGWIEEATWFTSPIAPTVENLPE